MKGLEREGLLRIFLRSPKDSGDGQDLKLKCEREGLLRVFLKSPKDSGDGQDSEVRLLCEMDYLGKANNTDC